MSRPHRSARFNAVRPETVPAGAFVRVFRVPSECAGMRVDVFLSRALRNTSRTRAKAIAGRGVFTLDGRPLRPSDRLGALDHIAVWRRPVEELDEVRELPVLYEDEHLLVIDKPPLLTVHPTARHHNVTVIRLLEQQRPNERLALAHRLDRETSGILLVTRTPEADRAFKRLIEDRSIAEAGGGARAAELAHLPAIGKTYLAITWNVPESGLIDRPLDTDPSPLRVKMRVVERGRGLEARTEIAVLETAGDYALVACRLLTGRQHQIRVHLASVGCPVVGDKLYGPDERLLARAADRTLTDDDYALLELPRHALHANRYELPHAITGEPLVLVAPLADDLAEFWAEKKEAAEAPGNPPQAVPAN